jgi:hypothetical protein
LLDLRQDVCFVPTADIGSERRAKRDVAVKAPGKAHLENSRPSYSGAKFDGDGKSTEAKAAKKAANASGECKKDLKGKKPPA